MTPQLRSVAISAGAEHDLLVLDTRSQPTKLEYYHWRPWLSGGCVCKEIQAVAPADNESLSTQLLLAPSPLAVVVRFQDDTWSSFSEELAATHGSRIVQMVEHSGHFLVDAKRLPPSSFLDETRSTTVEITGKNTRIAHQIDLPCTVSFSLGDLNSASNLMKVSARNRHERNNARLPAPVWLRIVGRSQKRGTLRVNIVPNVGQDDWCFGFEGDQFDYALVPTPEQANPLQRVALVFDRTCPDWERWGDALELAHETHKAPEQFPNFNGRIRQAVEESLAEYPWPSGARCHFAWFADEAGDGVSPLKGVHGPGVAWGSRGEFALPAGAHVLQDLTYFPGLDTWDPLEEGMAETIEYFRRSGSGTLLIIGNSPPRYPRGQSPFKQIALSFGFETMHRTTTDRWDRVLSELSSIGIGIYYVFLRLGARVPDQEKDFGVFDALQGKVEFAFNECFPGRVFTGNADAQGIRGAVREALGQAERDFGSSGVEILSVGAK